MYINNQASLDAYSRLTAGVEAALDEADQFAAENEKRYTHEEVFANLRRKINGWYELRLPNAEAFEPYHSASERRYKYYRIYVKNYIVYYVVIDDEGSDKIMEVRRFLYNKQNQKNSSKENKI